MWVLTLLALLLCAMCFVPCSESPMWEYRFVNKNLTWSEAQQFCRQHYHDLACVSSSEDNLRLPRPPGYSAPVWIGLYDDLTDQSQWKWTATGSSASYKQWWSNHPKFIHEAQQCCAMDVHAWFTDSCLEQRPALCYSGSSPKVFHLSSDNMTWYEALTFCRTHYKALAMIESSEENTAAVAKITSWWAWIGLYRFGGTWSDHRAVTFSNWYSPGARGMYTEPICAVENVHNSWDISSCQEKRPFYCQEEAKSRRFVKIKLSGQELDRSMISQDILDEIKKSFEAAGRSDVKIKWRNAPEKQEEKKDKAEDCPDH